ncbi:hypothetical protein [Catalinimonas alkaloidigena]|uniref:hypothetical protein n=1 Tax=Catalinimonas alkaloidigena TaxID=1075417 RepID=UPI0024055067|nr:hypothetical protein [Catalinimonas alkaloidigena]
MTILLVLLLSASHLAFSQNLELAIDTLRISRVIQEGTGEITFHEDGPVLEMKVSIYNDEDSSISIYPSEARYLVTFNYAGKHYQKEIFPLGFMDNKKIQLPPKEKIKFRIAERLFYGTPVFSPNKTDYSTDLLKVLPTLEFKYIDINFSLVASKAEIVELIEN